MFLMTIFLDFKQLIYDSFYNHSNITSVYVSKNQKESQKSLISFFGKLTSIMFRIKMFLF